MLKGNAKWALYNLENDIKEENDLAAKHPDIVEKMIKISKQEHRTPALSRFLIPVLEREMK
ncbi:hypothetical protein D3C73_1001350 [compost metagenome]